MPLWLYLTGAGSAVAVSFLLYAFFLRADDPSRANLHLNLLHFGFARMLARRAVRIVIRSAALALFLLVLLAGFFGAQSAFRNIAPIMVWTIWWVGMPYTSALLGDVWRLVNPIDTIFLAVRHITGRHVVSPSRHVQYPSSLAAWPAVVFFFAAEWAELVWEHSDTPRYVAAALLGYCVISLLAMRLFGRDPWLRGGEAFTVVFGLFARFAPTEVRAGGLRLGEPGDAVDGFTAPAYDVFDRVPGEQREWNLRPYAVGLLNPAPVHASLLVLVILMLASVTFDGFIETPAWADSLQWILQWTGAGSDDAASAARTVIHTAALLLFAGVFFAVYVAFSAAIRIAARRRGAVDRPTLVVACDFVLTLLPIAIAYHIAHYLSFLLMAGQYLIPLSSDPMGLGWDLFGTTRYFVRIAIIDARSVWYLSVAAIIGGHIAAVYLGHATALRVFGHRAAAMASQIPMLVLMVGYTMISLWIIAQPIVTVR